MDVALVRRRQSIRVDVAVEVDIVEVERDAQLDEFAQQRIVLDELIADGVIGVPEIRGQAD